MQPSVATAPRVAAPAFDLGRVRADFPILSREIRGRRLVYLDNAASAQKPQAVLEAIARCYGTYYANVHRGVHTLSQEATTELEQARETVRRFANAATAEEVVFLRGTTEAANLVAQSWGRRNVQAGDEILVTEMEHHSNIVPWQLLCEERGATLRAVPIDDRGEIRQDVYASLLNERTRLVAFTHVSNVLGTVNPVAEMTALAHRHGAVVFVDGAQGVPHLRVDVQTLGCDFYAFSGHKLYGPSGIGVLYGKSKLLEAMPPWQGGGGMIRSVRLTGTQYAPPPQRFEAGTPAIEGAIGLAAAIDYLEALGIENAAAWEAELLAAATEALRAIPNLRILGEAAHKAAVLSFVLPGVHPHDAGTILDDEGIAVRAGHHCAQPLMERLCVPATTRASFAFYNTLDEVDALARGLHKARALFGV
jgi:cysteine desulfurase / selenocysteine lyase